uniref:mitogen-activated protein kinase n=1 Tax=Scleropages formosus TaxID=113540 RepID=A0A8C9TUY5_SCLFO
MAFREKRGFHSLEVNKTMWEVPDRYTALKQVGSGAYGTVCSAIDQKTKEKVAIKKLHRPFQSLIHAKRAYRELRLLRHIQHDNVGHTTSLCNSYIVMPFVAQDLGHIMKKRRLTDRIITYLFYQILRGLKARNPARRHLCFPFPLSVCLNLFQILDFGLARHTESEMTGYVVTRWYRAPEVIFNWMHYSQTVDVWSAGCILAEMITGQVLFPGNDSIDQLQKILSVTGTPAPSLVQKMQSKDPGINTVFLFFHHYNFCFSTSLSLLPFCTLSLLLCPPSTFFPHVTLLAVALLEAMLLLDPEKRVTAKEGLSHPYLSEFHDPESEPESPPYDDSFESMELVVGEWKKRMVSMHCLPKHGGLLLCLHRACPHPHCVNWTFLLKPLAREFSSSGPFLQVQSLPSLLYADA